MKRDGLLFVLVGILLALLVTGCTTATTTSGETATAVPPTEVASGAVEDAPAEATAPDAVSEAFYTWYLDYIGDRASGEFRNPLVDGAYRDSEYLSADFVAQIDEELANMGDRDGYDPILLAQDVPVQIETEEPSINGNAATVVLLRYWGGNPEPAPLVVHLRQENGRWLINNVTPFEMPETSSVAPQPLSTTTDMAPEQVVQVFYDWYLGYIGDRATGEFRNPLVDKVYQDSPLLTPEFIARVDETVAGFDHGGYDPFLLAQDIPQNLFATWTMITGDKARVTVLRNWGPPNMDAIFAHLVRRGDVWLIDDITPVELYEASTETPEGTVQMFYAWYTNMVRRSFEDESVTVDYHDSDLLTHSFKQHLDDIRAEAEAANPEMGLHYDPLLCAQDVPYHVTPDQALIDGETAALTAHTSFPNQLITVDLQLTDAGWRISNVTCTVTPEASARAFYTWYLGYIGDRGAGDFRNPLVDKAYRGHALLSPEFVQQVDGMFDAQGSIGHDPFLLAQDVPADFSVDPGVEAGTAVVHFQFGPDIVRRVLVTMKQEGIRWQITDVTEAEPLPSSAPADDGAGATGISSEYGFSFAYPGDWVVEELDMEGPGVPDDWPVVAGWQLMPADVAAQLAAQGAPDPNAPVIVAPFSVEVVVGDADAVARAYRPLSEGEKATSNEHEVTVFTNDPGYKQYVFPHPGRPDVWVVVSDWVTEFPGREEQAAVAAPALAPFLESFVFNE